jgi:hypothetical protein
MLQAMATAGKAAWTRLMRLGMIVGATVRKQPMSSVPDTVPPSAEA